MVEGAIIMYGNLDIFNAMKITSNQASFTEIGLKACPHSSLDHLLSLPIFPMKAFHESLKYIVGNSL